MLRFMRDDLGRLKMANLVERRCSYCGNVYKHEEYPSYISFCPKCKRDGFFEPYYTDDGIMPCRIFLGDETIGVMTSVTETSYIITSDRFDIHESIDDSLNPYLEATNMLCYMLREPNKVVRLKEKLKRQFLRENPNIIENDYLNLAFEQAIVEVMKRIYDKAMEQTQKSMEKTFFLGLTDKNKSAFYESEKGHWKRALKKIEKFHYVEGQKYENLSSFFPDGFKGLKNERDDTKSNFESNHYNISIQNAHEIRTFDELNICDAILKKRISSVKKVSNGKFEDLFKEYDDHYAALIDSGKDTNASEEEYLLVFFDLFNFEDKYSLEWVYSFSDYAVKNSLADDVFDRAKWLYASPIRTPNGALCMNRAFFLKERFLTLLLECNDDEFTKRLITYTLYVELVYALKTYMINDSMLEEIPKSEWVDFIKDKYDLFRAFNRDKEWEPKKKIITARRVFDEWDIKENEKTS